MTPVTLSAASAAARSALLCLTGYLSLASCMGPGYGGRPVDIEVHTKPEGLTAYVLHEETWAKSGRPLFQKLEAARGKPNEAQARKELLDWLESYRLREKTTPVKCTVSSHHQILVARKDPAIDYLEFDPIANKAPCLELKSHD